MATFSTNQVRHVYVSKSFKSSALTNSAIAGDLAVVSSKGPNGVVDSFYIQSMGKGGLMRSPLIEIKNVVAVNNTLAAKMAHPVKKTKIALKSGIASSSAIKAEYAGKDFIVRINFKQYVGIGEDETMVKHGVVRTYTGMTTSDFYKTLAISFANNMAREPYPLVKVYANTTEVKSGMKLSDISGTITYIEIKEVEQDWKLGITPVSYVNYIVTPATVEVDGAEIEAFDVTDTTSTTEVFGNGKMVADLEYFAMGDRGDIYRNINWPYSNQSETFLDGTGTYDLVDITFYWAGPCEDVQKSRKQITIIAESGKGAAIKSAIDAIISPASASTGA